MAAIKYKGTDGQWHLLNNILVSGINVVQTTGSSSADVMSQSAVTEAINSKQDDFWVSGTGKNSVILKNSSGAAVGDFSVAEGKSTTALSEASHAEGVNTAAVGVNSHAEGGGTTANGAQAHAEGGGSQAVGTNSHAEGGGSQAIGAQAHAEGGGTVASGTCSHSEGSGTKANGAYSHAEGSSTKANGAYSHSEGMTTNAIGAQAHAEGNGTTASGDSSHAEGTGTKANGAYSHAEGNSTIANNNSEHASGQYNVSSKASTTFGNSGNTLFSVGNGTSINDRHNAFEIRQNGDIYIINKEGNDVKLQDEIGNITIDQVIDSTTSASTDAVSTSAVYGFVTSYTPSITVDQVLDNTTSASTNPVSSKAVYDAVTDNELVWTNAYVTLSGVVSSHTADNNVHLTQTEKTNIDSLATNIAAISGITSTNVTNWNGASTNSHTHSNKTYLDTITGNVGTMAYENKTSYSSATDVNTALGNKANTGHTHEASGVTAMTGYQIAASSASVLTTDNLLQVIGKLEKRIALLETALGGISLVKISQTDYDKLPTPRDSNKLYIITD